MHIQSEYADKLCSLFKQNDCNNILESKEAKLLGVIGWSEVGFGYFFANTLILLFFPALIIYIALINIITLPYTIWSVWYQKVKAKQWCMLCIIVQILLWTLFFINYLFGYVQIPIFGFQEFIYTVIIGSIFLISILGVNMLVPRLNTDKTIASLRQALNSMKADENVFKTIIKRQPYYETSDCNSIIRFGNPNCSLQLTVISNPYCNPCSMLHKRIESLLQRVNNNISVQYILSSYNENLKSTNKYLIAACLANNGSTTQVLAGWYENGKELRNDYFKNLSLDMKNPEIEVEFQKHEIWKQKNQISAFPTILVNGYQLPDSYIIEDLQYHMELNIDTLK